MDTHNVYYGLRLSCINTNGMIWYIYMYYHSYHSIEYLITCGTQIICNWTIINTEHITETILYYRETMECIYSLGSPNICSEYTVNMLHPNNELD